LSWLLNCKITYLFYRTTNTTPDGTLILQKGLWQQNHGGITIRSTLTGNTPGASRSLTITPVTRRILAVEAKSLNASNYNWITISQMRFMWTAACCTLLDKWRNEAIRQILQMFYLNNELTEKEWVTRWQSVPEFARNYKSRRKDDVITERGPELMPNLWKY
jgi:hypothetical protein